MYSRHHAAISAVVAAGLVLWLPLGATPAAAAGAWALLTAVGVAIDLDHFAMARLVRGDWANARRAITDPRAALLDQSELFDPGDLWPLHRLLSHAVLAPVAVAAAWAVGNALAVAGLGVTATAAALATAVVLYVHVLTDLIWDVWRQDRYHENVRRVAGDDDPSGP
ncbi:hypothetical protein [Halobaculum magnesiiphilum]|uniref:Uncharacterized protein n=1 Tax=Halobaculum magnesiiphilum TaxID=1017351 RepID=A0A8T8WAD2_9EURY|nr:hypothetical protein [Halobaculum magnesiiphilum]QZP36781.1 hypothetical protein K6T50_10755 [Halobaculum magnesiiphilum]